MVTAQARGRFLATILSVLVLVTAALPAPGADRPLLDGPRVTAAAEDGVVLLTGAVDDVAAAVERVGGRVLGHLPLVGVTVADVAPEARDGLVGAPGVSITENAPVRLDGAKDSGTGHPADDQGPATLRADKLWKKGVDGSGVGIAVLDTGVSEVDELTGRVVGGVDLTWDLDGVDRYGHGTPVASLAAGTTTGVAPGAHVVPVKIAGESGVTDLVRLLLGLEWIAAHADDHGIRVVNISLGSAPVAAHLVDAAVQRLWDLGLVVVVAAGNGGEEPADALGTPASNTHAITVGATQGRDTRTRSDDRLAPWSSDGVDLDGNPKPDVVAPGQSVVVAASPGSWAYTNHPEGHLGAAYQRVSGTSFSTGLISGAAALLLDANPDWTPDEVLGQLVTTGKPVAGTDAPTPRVDKAVKAAEPAAANEGASGASEEALAELLALGPPDPFTLMTVLNDRDAVVELGSGWYGSGWYGSGWYETEWFGSGWYGSGWYGSGWYDYDWSGSGWYGDGFVGSGWYDEEWLASNWDGSGWYGSGWYGSGWYGAGWYGSGWYGSGWYGDYEGSGWYGSGWYEQDWQGSGWYGSGWDQEQWEGSGWYGSGWYDAGWS